MKNLKKLTRIDLKSLKGGGKICGDYFPQNPPDIGTPFQCDCGLAWCEKMTACVHPSFFSPENCWV